LILTVFLLNSTLRTAKQPHGAEYTRFKAFSSAFRADCRPQWLSNVFYAKVKHRQWTFRRQPTPQPQLLKGLARLSHPRVLALYPRLDKTYPRLETQFFKIWASQMKLGHALKRDPDLNHGGIIERFAQQLHTNWHTVVSKPGW